MLTYPTVARPSRRALALALPLTLIIAACGAAAAPTPSPAGTPRPTPTAVLGGSVDPGGNGGNTGGGSDPGDPGMGGGIVFPLPGGGDDPLLGDATVVVPKGGTLNPQPVDVQLVSATVQDGRVIVEARWTSGVEDCYPTDSVDVRVDEAAKTIHLRVLEGSAGGDVICIEIAVLKATAVDLGALAAGTWTISAEGTAEPIELRRRLRIDDRRSGRAAAEAGVTEVAHRRPPVRNRVRGLLTGTCVTIRR
jgi:hypothetical protein